MKDVEINYDFQVQCRGEINKIEWFRISELMKQVDRKTGNASMMSKFLTIIPFLNDLRHWIENERQKVKKAKFLPKKVLQRIQTNTNENEIYETQVKKEIPINSLLGNDLSLNIASKISLNEVLNNNKEDRLPFEQEDLEKRNIVECIKVLKQCDQQQSKMNKASAKENNRLGKVYRNKEQQNLETDIVCPLVCVQGYSSNMKKQITMK